MFNMSFSKQVKCMNCKHYYLIDKAPFSACTAYPTGIPNRIFQGISDHDKHRPFDKGYRYEPKDKTD